MTEAIVLKWHNIVYLLLCFFRSFRFVLLFSCNSKFLLSRNRYPIFVADDFKNSTTASILKQSLITTSTNKKNKGRPTIQPTKRQSMTITTTQTLNTTEPCQCVCKDMTLTTDQRAEIARNISKNLSVDKDMLSSTIRSKTSAEDLRPSAARIGYIGVLVLVIVFGGLFLIDVFSFLKYFFGSIKARKMW